MPTQTVVWIDHKEARILQVHPKTADETTVLAPQHHPHRHPKGRGEAKEHPDDAQSFFGDVARALDGVDALLIVGPSSAKLECFRYRHEHDRRVLLQPLFNDSGYQVEPNTIERTRSSMHIEIGHVEAIFQYPVKSMGGERLEVAELGWYGLEGDRRLAFRRIDDRSGMPWLTASKLPDLLLFAPHRREDGAQGDLPTHVRTPDGEEMPVFGEDLATEVGRRYGAPVQMMQLRHGIFDEASISVIASDTVREIARLAGQTPDVRRFRPNVVVRLLRSVPFQEDEWVGGVLSFGEGDDAPAITVTMRDIRCSMVNLDPDSASPAPEVLKAVVRVHQNTAGIYGAVTRIGQLAVGQTILLRAATIVA
jgi:uncharacterized protein YcbX